MSAPAPANELESLRRKLVAARQALPDRLERSVRLQEILRVWLVGRRERTIGAYWPIKGEFDPLPALYRWSEGGVDVVTRLAERLIAGGAPGLHFYTLNQSALTLEICKRLASS